MTVPADQEKDQPGVRTPGLGTLPATWAKKYGAPLAQSEAPTIYVFRGSMDTFPDGNGVIVSFDKGSIDQEPRAVQISFIAGNKHPTTLAQAQAIAQGFFPTDTSSPSIIQSYDPHENDFKNSQCQALTYTSKTLAKLFPPQDFLDKQGGLAPAGSVTISFFPLYSRTDGTENNETASGGAAYPVDENQVSSILITLGTKTYC
ncbi:hypothetical protein [Ktedonobacter racemifer]|uniref:Uncharacterized protein n=1 Tax=Ktedonobacter racemifer DSM 44963 TaxID=485913 RepID=D6U037_KTERA|nr:hypothetical protein [Ktedonobacter racemifer]EFH82177.1 hypothetical protein Krac_2963 [Ktedonobacter racemifer DSM 44963]